MIERRFKRAIYPTLATLLVTSAAFSQQRKLNPDETSAVEAAIADTHHWTEVYPCPELVWDTISVSVWPEQLRMDPGLNGKDGSGMRTYADDVKPDGTNVFTEDSGNNIGIGTDMIDGGDFDFGCSSDVNSLLGGGMLYSETAHQDLDCELGANGVGNNANQKKFLESELEALDRWERYLGWLLSAGSVLLDVGDEPKVRRILEDVEKAKKKTKEILDMF